MLLRLLLVEPSPLPATASSASAHLETSVMRPRYVGGPGEGVSQLRPAHGYEQLLFWDRLPHDSWSVNLAAAPHTKDLILMEAAYLADE